MQQPKLIKKQNKHERIKTHTKNTLHEKHHERNLIKKYKYYKTNKNKNKMKKTHNDAT